MKTKEKIEKKKHTKEIIFSLVTQRISIRATNIKVKT